MLGSTLAIMTQTLLLLAVRKQLGHRSILTGVNNALPWIYLSNTGYYIMLVLLIGILSLNKLIIASPLKQL